MAEYSEKRKPMVELGLLSDDGGEVTAREIEDFRARIKNTHLLMWLMQLPVFPDVMDRCDPVRAEDTVLGRCRQWAQEQKSGKGCDYRRGRDQTPPQRQALTNRAVKAATCMT